MGYFPWTMGYFGVVVSGSDWRRADDFRVCVLGCLEREYRQGSSKGGFIDIDIDIDM